MTRPIPSPVREGDLLAGKYRVDRVLGAGGMGIVVAARHEQLDQMVALKFVREEALDNEEAVQRFLREARAAVKLKSEHVARVLDVGKLDSGAPYMVMEYLEGNDLAKVLADHGPMDFSVATDFMLQACEAVAEAHAAGIVHRDLKPENLFLMTTVGGTQKVKVLDFGVSKAMDTTSAGAMGNLTRTRAMLGSPLYMAPEQMRSSRDVDPRADVWAMGVVLFQLLTQRWPFEADTMPELCLRVVTEPPTSLTAFRPEAPPGLASVIARCVEKEPSHRYGNAAELATALEPFASPESRILAERARLAMEPRTATGAGGLRASRPMSRVTTPGATQRNAPAATLHSGQTPQSPPPSMPKNTPGTSAAWGHERVVTALAPPLRPKRSTAMIVGAVVLGLAALGALAFALRGPGSAGGAAAAPPLPTAVAVRPEPTAMATVTTLPPAPQDLLPPAASSTPEKPADSAQSGQGVHVTVPSVAPGHAPAARPAASGAHAPTKPASAAGPQDDDIPTIR
ncbi:MAG TPA: protein kinase [Polyangiaceae bacterium]|jgi:serine/threonine-protein kinase|nr:protein kinase [Polyangiaceae bacterium]